MNLSLSVLRKCFHALKQGKRVPFRDNKLTHFLKEYFNENKRIVMIVNINPSHKDFDETLQVLEYGTIAKKIDLIKSRINNRIGSDYFVNRKKRKTVSVLSKFVDEPKDSSHGLNNILATKGKNKSIAPDEKPSEKKKFQDLILSDFKKEMDKSYKQRMDKELEHMSKHYSKLMNDRIELFKKQNRFRYRADKKSFPSSKITLFSDMKNQQSSVCSHCTRESKSISKNKIGSQNHVLGKKRVHLPFAKKKDLKEVNTKLSKIRLDFDKMEKMLMKELNKVSNKVKRNRKNIDDNKREIRVGLLI